MWDVFLVSVNCDKLPISKQNTKTKQEKPIKFTTSILINFVLYQFAKE